MLWPDSISGSIAETYREKIKKGEPIIIRDEKTASGRVHIGSMRGAAIHGIIHEILSKNGVSTEFLWEINDFDPMDGLPVYIDQSIFEQHLGKPLYTIPSPDGKAKNFAEFYADEFKGVIEGVGFKPKFYRGSELYLSGKMNAVIKIALEKAGVIRKIYKEVSGSIREDDWLPLNVICENCGKISTTKASNFDGEKVSYVCSDLEWTKGCGHKGTVSPFNGRAKLPWKVEWPAKWKVVGVTVEGAGKDHSTRGGSRDLAKRISKEVFEFEPPYDIPYEFFLVGGRKMSSSKGMGSSAKEIYDLLPPHIFRLALLQKNINQAINFDPAGDTISVLFDNYDRLAEKYFNGEKDDEARLFELIHKEGQKVQKRFLPRFSQIAFMCQMPHLVLVDEVSKLKGAALTAEDKEEVELREKYAHFWLSTYATDDFKFELQINSVPEKVNELTLIQRKAISAILDYIKEKEKIDGQEMHTFLHGLKEGLSIDAKDLFSAIYVSILGKSSGPKAGWFLSVLDRDFLVKRFTEII